MVSRVTTSSPAMRWFVVSAASSRSTSSSRAVSASILPGRGNPRAAQKDSADGPSSGPTLSPIPGRARSSAAIAWHQNRAGSLSPARSARRGSAAGRVTQIAVQRIDGGPTAYVGPPFCLSAKAY